jgi:hypothetical protein
MVASSISLYVTSVRSTGPARKGCLCDKMQSSHQVPIHLPGLN